MLRERERDRMWMRCRGMKREREGSLRHAESKGGGKKRAGERLRERREAEREKRCDR